MNVKVGDKLLNIRIQRNLSQTDFADMLAMSTSAYARLERNETTIDFEQIVKFSDILKVPVQDFFPENVVIHNRNEGTGAGVVFGNYIVNINNSVQTEIEQLKDSIIKIESYLRNRQ
jgi:transcriptional regulator with XRE-family HTH domain